MSEFTPKIWMNVTTSANWHRAPVGIVRVEQSLCSELSRLYGEQFKQCVWQDGDFIEWSPKIVEKQNALKGGENQIKEATLQPYITPPLYPLLSRRLALIALAQGLLSLAPNKIRPYLNHFLCSLRLFILRMIKSDWVVRFRPLIRSSPPLPLLASNAEETQSEKKKMKLFSSGDVLISVGLDWGYEFYKEFYFLRKEKGVRVVTCCYDLIPVIYPQYCVGAVAGIFTSYFLEIADGSDLILCISNQTEKDLQSMLYRVGGAKPKTYVFPLGDNVPIVDADDVSPSVREICKEPFILYVSTIERRKNHEVLYRAYHLLCEEGKREILPKLLFVGMKGWGVGDLQKDIELDPLTLNLIIQLDTVTDGELRALYEAAEFCVYPSLYEGWGLPVGEALSMGKVVLSSNAGSLPEVGGGLVVYVDPWDIRDWARKIFELSSNATYREDLEKKVRDSYMTRTWSQAALSVYKQIQDL